MAKPDYKLKIQTRGSKYGSYVGAAWKNKAGGINIKIEPGIGIIGQEGVDVTLWPNEERQGGGGDFTPRGGGQDPFGDDEMPF